MKLDEALASIDDKTVKEVIEKHLFTDIKTGLPNQNLLELRLEEFISRSDRSGKPFTYAAFDVGGVKYANDLYGREKGGDVLIKAAANFLLGVIRPYDFLSRQYGDDFVTLFENMDETHHYTHSKRVELQAEQQPLVLGKIPLVFHIGYAEYSGQEKQELLEEVDEKLNNSRKKNKEKYPWLIRK